MLITLAVLLCSVAVSAHDFEVDGIYYKILSSADLTVAVTYKGNAYYEFDNEYSGKIIIPSTVIYKSKTLSVTSIGYRAFWNCSGLTSITIPNSVTSIRENAFEGCSGLTSITIPNSVTSIGEIAFVGCSGLTSITIPNSVTSIGNYAFERCTSLKDLRIEDGTETLSLGCCVYYKCPLETLYLGRNLSYTTYTNDYSPFYSSKTTLTSVTIGDSVTSIGSYAFYYCGGLTSITIPNSVTSIGYSAFRGCNGLTKVTLNCKEIEYWFSELTSIKEVVIGNSVTSIAQHAFVGCSGLTSVTIGNSVTSIGDWAFSGCSSLTSIYLLGVTPPTVRSGNFTESQYVNLTLYVPKGSLETYQSAGTWKIFWDIQEFDATGIEGVNANDIAIEVTANGITLSDADGKTVAIYSANGTRVANIDSYVGEEITLDRGVYIVRVGNNTLKVKL